MTKNSEVRTRFAPSPTGYVHPGGIRTALFNFLEARARGGKFVLRIENTDQGRVVPAAVEQIMSALKTMGLPWDEGPDIGGPYGPYTQSERLPIYHKHAARALDSGHFYKCWCSEYRLRRMELAQKKRHVSPGYDHRCRFMSPYKRAKLELSGAPFVLRLAMPLDGEAVFRDDLRGEIVFQNKLLTDQVMLKSDGFPTYNFAVVVDDHEMKITHVMRGDEFIPSTPYHARLYDIFSWNRPTWVHLPPVLREDGLKMSKRLGDPSLHDFLDRGYLESALLSILCLTGFARGDGVEKMTLAEMVACWNRSRISRSAGALHVSKLESFNREDIRKLSAAEFIDRLTPYLIKSGLLASPPVGESKAVLETAAHMSQQRVTSVLPDGVEWLRPFLVTPAAAQWSDLPRQGDATMLAAVDATVDRLAALPAFETASIQALMKELATSSELGKDFYMWMRVAILGMRNSVPLFESMQVLGRDEVRRRILAAREWASRSQP